MKLFWVCIGRFLSIGSFVFLAGLDVSAESLSLLQQWKYFEAPHNACDFFLSDQDKSLFVQAETRTGALGSFINLQMGQVVQLRGYFSNLAYVTYTDINRGFAIIVDKNSHFLFDFKKLQKSPLDEAMQQAFSLRYKAFSPNGQYVLSASDNGNIAIRNFDSPLEATDIQVTLPKNSGFIADNKISDTGKTFALQIRENTGQGKSNFETQVWQLGGDSTKKPKVTTVPGSLIYLSPDGKLLITRTSKIDHQIYSITEAGKLQPISLKGLNNLIKRLWNITDPDNKTVWENDVRIKNVKISENGRWLVADMQYVVHSKITKLGNGAELANGTHASLVARWDLLKPNLPAWISDPIIHRYYDYLISDEGLLAFAAVEDKDHGDLVVWRSDQSQQKREVPFRQKLADKNLSVFNLKFSESNRRLFIEMNKGLLVVDL